MGTQSEKRQETFKGTRLQNAWMWMCIELSQHTLRAKMAGIKCEVNIYDQWSYMKQGCGIWNMKMRT